MFKDKKILKQDCKTKVLNIQELKIRIADKQRSQMKSQNHLVLIRASNRGHVEIH